MPAVTSGSEKIQLPELKELVVWFSIPCAEDIPGQGDGKELKQLKLPLVWQTACWVILIPEGKQDLLEKCRHDSRTPLVDVEVRPHITSTAQRVCLTKNKKFAFCCATAGFGVETATFFDRLTQNSFWSKLADSDRFSARFQEIKKDGYHFIFDIPDYSVLSQSTCAQLRELYVDGLLRDGREHGTYICSDIEAMLKVTYLTGTCPEIRYYADKSADQPQQPTTQVELAVVG